MKESTNKSVSVPPGSQVNLELGKTYVNLSNVTMLIVDEKEGNVMVHTANGEQVKSSLAKLVVLN